MGLEGSVEEALAWRFCLAFIQALVALAFAFVLVPVYALAPTVLQTAYWGLDPPRFAIGLALAFAATALALLGVALGVLVAARPIGFARRALSRCVAADAALALLAGAGVALRGGPQEAAPSLAILGAAFAACYCALLFIHPDITVPRAAGPPSSGSGVVTSASPAAPGVPP